jgi:hypothetical protein
MNAIEEKKGFLGCVGFIDSVYEYKPDHGGVECFN